jgi:hypothetical protein
MSHITLLTLPSDMIKEIAFHLDEVTLSNLCVTSDDMNRQLNEEFALNRMKQKYSVDFKTLKEYIPAKNLWHMSHVIGQYKCVDYYVKITTPDSSINKYMRKVFPLYKTDTASTLYRRIRYLMNLNLNYQITDMTLTFVSAWSLIDVFYDKEEADYVQNNIDKIGWTTDSTLSINAMATLKDQIGTLHNIDMEIPLYKIIVLSENFIFVDQKLKRIIKCCACQIVSKTV